ncbi:putative pentatricopeptide repeat-containing protein At1g17630 [Pistacia vera]|uniref:putative pentatricopeptide repeat-containing protein At1g17630 n=1 Tax=Pistacia vera TaxID=55513 RepID=UPI001263E4F4|nr:putative pentatricopeptide repeat-containing protein At1g17630 [Pistacia vera]
MLHAAASLRLESRRWFSIIPHQNDLLDIFDHFLQQCTKIHLLKQVHAQVIVNGSSNSAFLAARVTSVYARFGLLSDAQNVFKTTPVHCLSSSLLWNSILRVNVSNGCYENALQLYVEMRQRGVLGDGFTFPLIIRACKLMGSYSFGRIVHNHVLLMGFQDNVHVVNELIGMYAKMGRIDYSCKMFDKMRVRNHVSWNSMVSGFALNYDCDGALDMFQRMEFEGLEPNLVTWTSLLSSHARCGRLEDTIGLFDRMRMRGIGVSAEALAVVLSACADLVAFKKGMVIHGCVLKGGFENYLFVKNALICVYGKHGDVKEAEKLFLEMKDKNIVSWNALITSYAETGLCDEALAIFLKLENLDDGSMERPNVISWSAVIGAFASKGRGEESLYLFHKMQNAKVMANSVTISSVLSVCAELAALNIGREIHGHVVRALMDTSILVVNGLLNMYMKCGCLGKGRLLFERIDRKDLISWNSMITGYGMNGLGENAIATFNQMIEAGFKPDGVTFVALLSACSHAGLVDEGRRLFDMMVKEFRIEPQMEHYACMVDLLGRAGLMQDASDIVKNIPIEPNACVWGALLNSCRMHKNTDVADALASRILSQNMETTGNYMLLSNIYAASGRWEDSARVRISAKTKGLKKVAGQSWIELQNKVHMFSSGNSMQLDLKEVCEILEELARQMESEGYITDKNIIAEDVEEEIMVITL